MTNEAPVTDETTSKFSALKARITQLPLKKIAIAAAVTTVAAIVIANKDKFGSDVYTLEATNIQVLDDNGTLMADITPITD